MLKLGVALANKELALKVTKHLTKDEMFDITDLSKQCDLMLIDKNVINKCIVLLSFTHLCDIMCKIL